MNINTPTNSRKLSILAQYILNTDVDKFVKLAESFDTVEQLAKSKQYLRMASLLSDVTPNDMQPSEYVLQVMRQSVPPNALAVKSLSIIHRLKHLPGKHNQASHGRKRGGSGGGSTIDLSVEARKKPVATDGQLDMFGMLDTSANKSVQQQLDEYSANESTRRQRIDDAVVVLQSATAEYRNALNEFYKKNPNAYYAQSHPDVEPYLRKAGIAEGNLMLEIQKQHRARGAEISHMSADAQNALYDSLDLSVNDRGMNYAHQTALALGIYGNPDLRLRVAQHYYPGLQVENAERVFIRIPKFPNAQYQHEFATSEYGVDELVGRLSLEYRLVQAKELAKKSTYKNVAETVAEAFTYTHTSQTTTGSDNDGEQVNHSVLGAAMQTAVSQVGPNRGLNPVRNFWPDEVKPPMPHPEIVAALQTEYESHQRRLRITFPEGYIRLYRGEKLQPGNPYEPFTTNISVAKRFSQPGGYVRDVYVPIESIFTSEYSANWSTNFTGESEYLVLGTHFSANTTETPVSTFEWNGKDVAIVSNYSDTSKSFVSRLKSLMLTIMLLYS